MKIYILIHKIKNKAQKINKNHIKNIKTHYIHRVNLSLLIMNRTYYLRTENSNLSTFGLCTLIFKIGMH